MNHKCDETRCVVHARNNGIKPYVEADGTESGMYAAATYIGEYAVLTQISPLVGTLIASIAAAARTPMDIFVTIVAHVGDGPLIVGDKEFDVRYIETHTQTDQFPDYDGIDPDNLPQELTPWEQHGYDFHTGIVSMVQSGALDLSQSISSDEQTRMIKRSIKV